VADSDSNDIPVGIDLGTTFSVVASLDSQGRPYTIQNSEGDVTTPSVVMFDQSNVIVGKEAVKLASYEPDAVAAYAKRDIGARRIGKAVKGNHLPPEVVESLVLSKLKSDAELKLGPISNAVITVPAYFNETRRKATQDAGRLAKIDVLDIINEPTAAAIAFGVERGFLSGEGAAAAPETVLVYDLGGGTFDVTLMRLDGHDYTALATAGDVYLGGIDWDKRIADHVAETFAKEHNFVDPRKDASALLRLCKESEDAKRALSARDEVNIAFEHDGRLSRVRMTREEFESLTVDLVERTRFTVKKLLQDAKTTWEDVTRLLLVGGSTRMPMIIKMLETESGMAPDRSLAADEAVAHGAAVYAGYLLGGKMDAVHTRSVGKITNVNSHDLGVLATEAATGRPRRKILIARNTALPARQAARFVTQKSNQVSVNVHVIEGGDDSGHNATPVGVCQVTNLPPGLPKKTPVFVEFKYEENGRLTVKAQLPDVGTSATMEIQREANLSDEELDTWANLIAEGNIIQVVASREEKAATQLEDLKKFEDPVSTSFEDVEFAEQLDELGAGKSGSDTRIGEAVSDAEDVADSAEEAAPDDDEADPELEDFLKGLP
jgi:molecular chaperone DnaK